MFPTNGGETKSWNKISLTSMQIIRKLTQPTDALRTYWLAQSNAGELVSEDYEHHFQQ